MADVRVTLEGEIIHAVYTGTMTMDLVRDGERRIEALLGDSARTVLYDTLGMDPPTMDLALEMKAFDGRIRTRVARSATVVRDPMTAFLSQVAFVMSRNHRVFYDNLDAAYVWLRS
jgi:hypothetical protein